MLEVEDLAADARVNGLDFEELAVLGGEDQLFLAVGEVFWEEDFVAEGGEDGIEFMRRGFCKFRNLS